MLGHLKIDLNPTENNTDYFENCSKFLQHLHFMLNNEYKLCLAKGREAIPKQLGVTQWSRNWASWA